MDIPDRSGDGLDATVSALRPSMDDVRGVLEETFASMEAGVRVLTCGPPSWVWEDSEMVALGLPKYYVLTESTSTPGHPLFTIRQSYSPRFDSWVTMSGLVLGRDTMGIARSISLVMAHHSGAFAGVKFTVDTISANANEPIAGMIAVKMIMEAAPARLLVNEAVAPGDDAKVVN